MAVRVGVGSVNVLYAGKMGAATGCEPIKDEAGDIKRSVNLSSPPHRE